MITNKKYLCHISLDEKTTKQNLRVETDHRLFGELSHPVVF